ncbi:hypothetical protein CHS0354_011004 [Potamilus streckersoni]|uniref:Thyrotropin-releasing hormone receptor n=1 Tax=Potamilus streckersoni TaxID=2493646 RepID=A0AAE0WHE2_9BIVA|nr:hypothetical protein CHS0354_011004 [Potamilus streckersoni]
MERLCLFLLASYSLISSQVNRAKANLSEDVTTVDNQNDSNFIHMTTSMNQETSSQYTTLNTNQTSTYQDCSNSSSSGMYENETILSSTIPYTRIRCEDTKSGYSSINITETPGHITRKEVMNLPDDVDVLPCSVLREYGTWNLLYKYTREQLHLVLCRCTGLCSMPTLSPKGRDEIWAYYVYNPLSEHNIETFITVVIVYIVILIVGAFGNILTIYGLICWVKCKSPTFAFIISLSCSDLLLLLLAMPIKVVEFFHLAGTFVEATCKLSYYLRDFTFLCSVVTLTVVSFERYYAICHPLKVQYRCTWTRARILILLTWLISFTLATPTIFMTKLYLPVGSIVPECLQQSKSDLYLQLYFTYYLGLLFIVPLSTMAFTYGSSCFRLWKSAEVSENLRGKSAKKIDGGGKKKMPGSPASRNEGTSDVSSRKRVVKQLVVVVVCFAVCWGTPLVVDVLGVFGIIRAYRDKIRLAAETLTFLNSTLNPYIFMGMSSQFRDAAWRSIARLKRPLGRNTTYLESSYGTQISSTSLYRSTSDLHCYDPQK